MTATHLAKQAAGGDRIRCTPIAEHACTHMYCALGLPPALSATNKVIGISAVRPCAISGQLPAGAHRGRVHFSSLPRYTRL